LRDGEDDKKGDQPNHSFNDTLAMNSILMSKTIDVNNPPSTVKDSYNKGSKKVNIDLTSLTPSPSPASDVMNATNRSGSKQTAKTQVEKYTRH